jgi:DNA-binding NtrC family response regulator
MLEETTPTLEHITGNRPKILIVEDDPNIAEILRDHLEFSLNADLQIASSAEEALEMDAQRPAELFIIDYLLPDCDGLDLIPAINAREERPILVMTGHPTLGRAIEAMRLGATDMFVKPFDLDVVANKISESLEEHRRTQRRFERIKRVRELSKKVIQERRGLRRKLDLLCKDFVGAHRGLAEKLTQLEQQSSHN